MMGDTLHKLHGQPLVKLLFIANALKQHHLGLEETDDGIWSIYFGTVLLAKVDERDMIIRD
jgi:hypothetical protein